MDPVIQKFRSALSGFNRRDVLTYIQRLSDEHHKELTRLQKELTRCEGERQTLEHTLAGLEDEKGNVAAEEARVRASLEASTAALTHLRGELGSTEEQLSSAQSELERCRQELAEVAPMAKSYEELKDRVATVELDAHRKAQATVDEANAEAARIRQETRQWLDGVLSGYGSVRQAVEGLLDSARALSAMEEQLRQADEKAAALKEQGN